MSTIDIHHDIEGRGPIDLDEKVLSIPLAQVIFSNVRNLEAHIRTKAPNTTLRQLIFSSLDMSIRSAIIDILNQSGGVDIHAQRGTVMNITGDIVGRTGRSGREAALDLDEPLLRSQLCVRLEQRRPGATNRLQTLSRDLTPRQVLLRSSNIDRADQDALLDLLAGH